jgi:putative molybdopterin biosynthesis protein
MQIIKRVVSEEAIKLLGDPTRLAILRILIAGQATISQIGVQIAIHPAQVRHHIKLLEKEGLVELVSVLSVKKFVEKYYRATSKMFLINVAILSEPPEHEQLVILASDDPALNFLVTRINNKMQRAYMSTLPVGSLDALIYLREKFSDIAGCHLYDMSTGEYNVPYIHHLFSDQAMVDIKFVGRQQGFYVKKGNPQQITRLQDLNRSDVVFKNRKRGTGTRLWVDQQFKKIGISPNNLNVLQPDAATHAEVAEAVNLGFASTGIGVQTVAQNFDLDFVPIFTEEYDLVMPLETFNSPRFQPVVETLQDKDFQELVAKMGGYTVDKMGQYTVI